MYPNVIFSDESRFCMQHCDGRTRVSRHRGELSPPVCIPYRHMGPAPCVKILDLSHTENIWSWLLKDSITHHPSPANAVDKVWHRMKAAWNELLNSVIQAQFDSMSHRQGNSTCSVRAYLRTYGPGETLLSPSAGPEWVKSLYSKT
ncbi:hypothetical protein TNCV_2169011 [Trichonephila clavipes]|nr:hypothetical protein TNCV_2169011 [Trichonephila clavipes]